MNPCALLEAAYEVAGLPCPTGRKQRRRGVLPLGRPAGTRAVPPMGYTAAAKLLDVTPSHLWRVLNGNRASSDLMRRYKALLKKEGAR